MRLRSLLAFSAFASFAASITPAARATEESEREAAHIRSRYDHWRAQRGAPDHPLPAGAFTQARAAISRVPRLTHLGAPIVHRGLPRPGSPGKPPRSPDELTWTTMGPAAVTTSEAPYETPNMGPEAGRASSIVIDPVDPSVLYAGYAAGGVWKSIDGGGTWTPLTDDQPTTAIGSLAIDPSDHLTVYAGTGEGALYAGFYGAGILKTTDAGATWTVMGADTFAGLAVSRIVVDPLTGDVYAATLFGLAGRGNYCTNADTQVQGRGLYKSTDKGDTWTRILEGDITDLEIDFTAPAPHIFVVDYLTGVRRSFNGGQTWSGVAGLPDKLARVGVEVAIAPSDPSVVYVGVGKDGGTLYLSTDGGASFTRTVGTPSYCEAQCDWDNSVIVDPTDPKVVWLGGSLCGIWKTTDAQDPTPTWANVSALHGECGEEDANWSDGFVHPDVHALALQPGDPNTFYAATDGGIARTRDGGVSWSRLNEGVDTLQFYGICLDPSDPDAIYGGSQDNGSEMRTTSDVWRGIISGDGGSCAVDITDPNTIAITNDAAQVFTTHDRFVSVPAFTFSTSGCSPNAPGCSDRTEFIAPLTGHPTLAGAVYIGTDKLYESTDSGDSWAAISGDLTAGDTGIPCIDGSTGPGDAISAISVSRSAAASLYTGSTSGVVHVTHDHGASWRRVGQGVLPGRYVTSIAVDPHDERRFFVAFSGFDAATPAAPGHVFETRDDGGTFQLREVPVDAPVNALLAHPVGSGLLYAATDVGVLVTADAGVTWAVLGDQTLPNAPAFSLAFHEKGRRLVAATHGRGVWALDLGDGAIAASPARLDVTAAPGAKIPASKLRVSDVDPYGSVAEFNVASDHAWLVVAPGASAAAGAGPVEVAVTFKADALPVGVHDAVITVTPSDGSAPIQVPVHLTLSDAASSSGFELGGGGCACRFDGGRGGAGAGLGALAAMALLALRRRARFKA